MGWGSAGIASLRRVVEPQVYNRGTIRRFSAKPAKSERKTTANFKLPLNSIGMGGILRVASDSTPGLLGWMDAPCITRTTNSMEN